jgi:hypothetical protein
MPPEVLLGIRVSPPCPPTPRAIHPITVLPSHLEVFIPDPVIIRQRLRHRRQIVKRKRVETDQPTAKPGNTDLSGE